MHIAARAEDRIHRWRASWARRRNLAVTVVPFRGYGTTEHVRVLCRVLLTALPKPGSRRARKMADRAESLRGWRSFVSVPVSRAQVTIEIEGEIHHVVADRGGVVDITLDMKLAPGTHTARIQSEDSTIAEAELNISPADVQYGLISDVDDTVMVTALPRPFLAFWNAFVLNEHARVPTYGMSVFLNRLTRKEMGMPVIYLSTGAWNVAPTLRRFLRRNLYPIGSMLLTDWGPTHDRWFRSGQEHKTVQLERLAQEFPHVKWILVGDDGQHDEALYAEFEAKHPNSVAAVCIRQLSTSEAVLAGGRKKGLAKSLHGGAPWVYGGDGSTLYEQLVALGFLERRL
jgi:phosphatidate phosphatase APP1